MLPGPWSGTSETEARRSAEMSDVVLIATAAAGRTASWAEVGLAAVGVLGMIVLFWLATRDH